MIPNEVEKEANGEPSVQLEFANVTPEMLTKLSIAHRQACKVDTTPTLDRDSDLRVTNEGATDTFRVTTRRLRLPNAQMVMSSVFDAIPADLNAHLHLVGDGFAD